jgi:Flp pilus assembly protein TadD
MERARTALRDEDPDASIVFANHALRYERRNPELYFYLGRALMASGNRNDQPQQRAGLREAGVEALQRAHTLEPLDGGFALSLAFAYDELGRFEDAERMFGIARTLDPRSQALAQLYQAHHESREKLALGAGGSL